MAAYIQRLALTLVILAVAAGGLSAQVSEVVITLQGNVRNTYEILFADSSKLVVWNSIEPYAPDKVSQYAVRLRPSEMDEIAVPREGHFLSGATTGFLTGAGAGVLIGLLSGNDNSGFLRFTAGEKAAVLGLSLGIIGTVAGGLVGVSQGMDEDIILNGSRERYLRALPKLKEKAMFGSTLPAELQDFVGRDEEPAVENARATDQESDQLSTPLFCRVHLSASGAILLRGGATDDITSAFNSSGFGGKVGGWFGPIDYPTNNGSPLSWNISGEYSLTSKLRLGLTWSSLPSTRISGKDLESESAHGTSYSLLCAYVFSPAEPFIGSPFEFAAAAGVSYNSLYVDGRISPFSYPTPGLSFHERKNALGFRLQVSCDYYFSRHFSLQGKTVGNIVPLPVDVPEVQYTAPYGDEPTTLIGHSVTFSGLDLSLGIGIHF